MENWKIIALLLAGYQGLFLSLALIFTRLRTRNPNVFLGVMLFVCAIEVLNAWGIASGYHEGNPSFPFWSLGSYLSIPPALWFFMKASTDFSFTLHPSQVRWFIPAIAEIILEFAVFSYRKITGSEFTLIRFPIWVALTEYVPVIAMPLVLFFQTRTFIHIRKELDTATVWRFVLFTGLFSLLTILWIADSLFDVAVYAVIELVLCLVLFALGYIVYFKPAFFDHLPLRKKQLPEAFAGYDETASIAKLKMAFEQDKLHLRQRLTLEELAEAIQLPERYVSYLIREIAQTNFNGFVNHYRIMEFLERMKSPEASRKTLLGIALDSGFSSKSTFNHLFKSVTGKSPSEYLSEYKKSGPES